MLNLTGHSNFFDAFPSMNHGIARVLLLHEAASSPGAWGVLLTQGVSSCMHAGCDRCSSVESQSMPEIYHTVSLFFF